MIFLCLALSVVAIIGRPAMAAPGEVWTLAGDGQTGTPQDSALALQSSIKAPTGVFVDTAGTIYFVDRDNHRVYKVSRNGVITPVAGNGSRGFSGDGRAATEARLNSPQDLFIDGTGNILVSDTGNHCIRKITPRGLITTIAGNKIAGYAGDGGRADLARLNTPTDLFIDNQGHLYIADTGNDRIRKITPDGTIKTVAGNGNRGFSGNAGVALESNLNGPQGIFVDRTGDMYFADTHNNRIRKVTPDGTLTTIVGPCIPVFTCDSGQSTGSFLNNNQINPTDVFIDDRETLYIIDANNGLISKLDTSGVLSPVVGDTTGSLTADGNAALQTRLSLPLKFFIDAMGNLVFSELVGRRVRQAEAIAAPTVLTPGTFPFNVIFFSSLPAGHIITFAGTKRGFAGDNGPAAEAQLDSPIDLAADLQNHMLISDSANHRIRRFLPGGEITTIAGNGTQGFSGDGGAATRASLNTPVGLATDAQGAVYFADLSNHRIRRIDPDGTLATIAGNGIQGFAGDGGFAPLAQLNNPTGLRIDPNGVLYFADTGNNRIRRITRDGLVNTVAGNGMRGYGGDGGPATLASLNDPEGLFVATDGLYIADTENHRLRLVANDGKISTIAGIGIGLFSGDGGPATEAGLRLPHSPYLDDGGALFFSDTGNNRIRKIAPDGTISTVAGNGVYGLSGDIIPATQAPLRSPFGLFITSEANLFLADRDNDRIRVVKEVAAPTRHPLGTGPTFSPGLGAIETVTGTGTEGFSGDGGPARQATITRISGLHTGPDGSLYLSDAFNHRIRKIAPDGTISTIAGNGKAGFSGDGGPATLAQINLPADILIDPRGDLIFADAGNHRIRKIAPDGTISTIAGNGQAAFAGDGGKATTASLWAPEEIARGLDGALYLSDFWNHRIRKIAPDGIISTIAGNGQAAFAGDGELATAASLQRPSGLAYVDGELIFSDSGNNRIRKIDSTGRISTIAGNGARGFAGDGGPATEASLASPVGLDLDDKGFIFFSDFSNNRVRRIAPDGIISTVAGRGAGPILPDGALSTQTGIAGPSRIFIDAGGDLIISEHLGSRVRRVKGITGIKSPIADPIDIPDATPTAVVGDFTGDTVVDFQDFFLFADHFGLIEGTADWDAQFDLNADGAIDFTDFFLFADAFGPQARGKLIRLAVEYLDLPGANRLEAAFPNPFNAQTTIGYHLLQPGAMELALFNLAGQRIKRLAEGMQQPGYYRYSWDGTDAHGRPVATGVYLIRLQAGNFSQMRKVMLVK